jgi:sugar lactone lactonase YvrE
MKTKKSMTGLNQCVSGILMAFVFFCAMPTPSHSAEFQSAMPAAVDPQYQIKILVPGSHFHGIHGLTFDKQDQLYAGSVVGQSIYRVDTKTGEVKVHVGPPLGMADDLEFGPDGRLCYTSFLLGKLHCMDKDGQVKVLAEGLPGLNSLAFDSKGRLFATQVFLGDALYEIDLSGGMKTRKIAEKMGGFNGFDVGSDGKLYGPVWFKGEIARIDPDTGSMETVAKGFKVPAAANFDSKGNLYVVDTAAGEVVRVDVKSGKKTVVAKVDPSIDNLAIDSRDRIFISNMANNGIYEIDPKAHKARPVVEGKLACAGGVAVVSGKEADTLYLTDVFSLRRADGNTGKVKTIARMHQEGAHLEYPFTVSVKGDSLTLTSWFTGTVQEVDRKSGHVKRTLGGFKAPGHALLMDDGSLIVAEIATGSILRVKGSEGKERTTVSQGLVAPTYLAAATPNAVYVTEAAGTVSRVDLASGEKKVIASGLRMPEGVAVVKSDKLVVVETAAKQLTEIDLKTGATKPLVKDLAVGFPAVPGTPPPGIITGVAVSKSGAIYVTGDVENVVYKITLKR